ncbi:uncharacterized protein LOC131020020 [Salvia miltiorrhiza]|uniref:uncharacterized protein LOC131020020 n=1 Tax=Salvia miltiorrhiza TaxID=226208 RepID=UPI0025AC43B0|nr:uncharacterized protein LOC131020020 [Salvia miltiorrhiza]
MAVSLNSVIGFNPTTNYQQGRRDNAGVSLLKISSLSGPVGLRQCTRGTRTRFHLVAAGGDNVATETSVTDSKPIEPPDSASDVNPSTESDKTEEPNGAISSTDVGKPSSNVKRASLTARERLRAARVLSRYTDSKPAKPMLGSRLLDALQQSDKGKKRPGLPEAPTNMLDDSKRGMPKEGWTIELPGGMDVFFIILSFVLISTVMFATTFVVWKVGAIHFNEY